MVVIELGVSVVAQAMHIQSCFRNVYADGIIYYLIRVLCMSCEVRASRIRSGLMEKTAVI
jgi:hypothetical protein